MPPIIPSQVSRFTRALGPERDAVIEDMDAYADEQGFPTVGPEIGGWLSLLTRLIDAQRVFEFGSGYGYSAYWFARALPTDGEVILTERDGTNIDRAHEYLERGGYLDRATIEQGDALEIIKHYDGPFDIVLLDNEKHRYREAFEAAREKVAEGGLVVADNAMTAGSIEFDALVDLVNGHEVETTESTRGIAAYLDTVTADPAFETTLLPLGEGLSVSHRRRT